MVAGSHVCVFHATLGLYYPSAAASTIAKNPSAWNSMLVEMEDAGQGYLLNKNAADAVLWCWPCLEFIEVISRTDALPEELLSLSRSLESILKQVWIGQALISIKLFIWLCT